MPPLQQGHADFSILSAPQIEIQSHTVLNKMQIWWELQIYFATVAVTDGGGGCDLRWVDDSREIVNIVHAQVGDGESAACHLSRAQLAFLGLHSHHHIEFLLFLGFLGFFHGVTFLFFFFHSCFPPLSPSHLLPSK